MSLNVSKIREVANLLHHIKNDVVDQKQKSISTFILCM